MTVAVGPNTPAGGVGEVARPVAPDAQRLVIVCHSAGSHSWGYAIPRGTTGPGAAAATAAAHGYTVAACDAGTPLLGPGYGPVSWGNDSALTATEDHVALCTTGAWAPVVADSGKVALVGYSMGFLTAVRYAVAHPDKVAALIGMVPAVNLAWAYSVGNATRRQQICDAYGVGGAPPGTLPSACNEGDPTHGTNADAIAALVDAGVPVEVWSSIGDTEADVDPDPHVVADWAALVGARHRTIQSGGHSGTGAPLGALYVDVLGRGRWT